MIKKEGSKWILYTKDGKKKLGKFDTEKEARERERQIQFFKHQKSEGAFVEIDLIITKASMHKDGSIHWQAVASDTNPDKLGERTSLNLFSDWIERATTGQSVDWLPPPRMPFLGISHYPDLDGYGEAGITERMYIDGNRFKMAGIFYQDSNHPLGKALFEAVRQERELIKRGEIIEKPIRISAAWWDIVHNHGDFLFKRKSLLDSCPICSKAKAGDPWDKEYLAGQIDHLASTRVPVHPRTSLGLEEKAMATRKEDAESIVGEELAEELEKRARPTGKSETEQPKEALIIKADEADNPDVEKAVETRGENVRVRVRSEDDFQKGSFRTIDIDEDQGIKAVIGRPKGETTTTVQTYLFDKEKWTEAKASKWVEDQKKKKKAELNEPEKADIEQQMPPEEMMTPEMVHPFDGATTMADAEAYINTQKMKDKLYTAWDLFNIVMQNILATSEPGQVKENVRAVVDEFGSRVDALKAAVSDAALIEPIGEVIMADENKVTEEAQTDPVEAMTGIVEAAIKNSELDRQGKLGAIEAAIGSYIETVKAQVDQVAPPDPADQIAEAVQKGLQPLSDQLGLLLAKLGNPKPEPVQEPQQKSMVPGAPFQQQSDAELPVSPITGKPSALTEMVRRSVGIVQ